MITGVWLTLQALIPQVARAAKAIPRTVWLVFACILTAVVLWTAHGHAVTSAYSTGFTAGVDSTKARAARAVVVLKPRVDTVKLYTDRQWKKTKASIKTAQEAIAAVPQEVIDSVPEVKEVLRSCSVALHDCEQFRADVMTERTVRDSVDAEVSIVLVAKSDSIATLKKRPSRKQAVALAILAGLIGFFIPR